MQDNGAVRQRAHPSLATSSRHTRAPHLWTRFAVSRIAVCGEHGAPAPPQIVHKEIHSNSHGTISPPLFTSSRLLAKIPHRTRRTTELPSRDKEQHVSFKCRGSVNVFVKSEEIRILSCKVCTRLVLVGRYVNGLQESLSTVSSPHSKT